MKSPLIHERKFHVVPVKIEASRTEGSLWTAVMFHASGNVFMQKFFAPLTLANEKTVWFGDEFGAIPALVAFMVAVYFWRKGKKEFSFCYPIRPTPRGETT